MEGVEREVLHDKDDVLVHCDAAHPPPLHIHRHLSVSDKKSLSDKKLVFGKRNQYPPKKTVSAKTNRYPAKEICNRQKEICIRQKEICI